MDCGKELPEDYKGLRCRDCVEIKLAEIKHRRYKEHFEAMLKQDLNEKEQPRRQSPEENS
jgi:hypothetical protein